MKKANYFQKFIEEIGFVDMPTQAKHLSVQILHDN